MSQKRCLREILRGFEHVVVAIVLLAAGLAPTIQAAEPSGGTISGSQDEATWTGTFYAPNPAACATSSDPLCDHFRTSPSGTRDRKSVV